MIVLFQLSTVKNIDCVGLPNFEGAILTRKQVDAQSDQENSVQWCGTLNLVKQ
jgi:hypothetical protein